MIVQGLWIGESLSTIERLSIASFLRNGHGFHLYTYGDVTGVPPGTTVLDASTIVGAQDIGQYPSLTAFSNIFRYELLLQKGGIWVDLDVVCLKRFHLKVDYLFPRTDHWLMWGRDRNAPHKAALDTWFIKAPPGSTLMRTCLERALGYAGKEFPWGTLGPVMLSRTVQDLGLEGYASHWRFFPMNWSKAGELLSGGLAASTIFLLARNAVAMHLYSQMWRWNKLDPDGSYDKASIFERLKSKYLE